MYENCNRCVLKTPPNLSLSLSLSVLLIFQPIPKFASVPTLLSSQSQRREEAAWEGCQPGSCI